MKRSSRCLALLITLPFWARQAFCVDPATAIQQQVIRTWGVDEGLPQGTVYGIAQTSDGYLWAATQEGFVRFDGSEFTVFDKRSSDAITNNMILTLMAAQDGSVYAASNGGGLIHVAGRRVSSYRRSNGLPSDAVSALYQSSDGTIWVGTQEGLARVQSDGRIVIVANTEKLPHAAVTAITEDWSGQLWIGTRHGIATWKDGRITRHDNDGFPSEHILALSAGRDGSVWIGTNGGGLFRYRSGQFRAYSAADGLASRHVSSIHEDRHGVLWIGTLDGGVGRFHNERFEFTPDLPGVGTKAVSSVREDREGNIWIGSTNGLTRIAQGLIQSFTSAQGLRGERVRTVHADRSGTLWIGAGAGLQTLDGQTIAKGTGLTSNMILSTFSGRDGSLWVGTYDAGLNRIHDGKTTVYDTSNGLNSNVVLSVYEDRKGVVWVGTVKGVQKIVDGAVTRETPKLSGQVIGVMREDRNGSLWVGTQDGGVNRILPDGKVTSFTTRNGLSNDFVLALHEDETGAIWVGTLGGGLNRFKKGRWTAVTTREGLFDDSVFAILEDDDGFLWMSCNKGIFRVARSQIDRLADGGLPRVTSIGYGRNDGMASRECNGGTQPVAWKTPDGKLWFATVKGVAMVDPSRVRLAVAPPVLIQNVFVDGERRPDGKSDPLAAGTKRLEFHYTGIHFAAPDKVHYQYMLEGFDRDWIDAGSNRRAFYTNLPAGEYRFRVRAAVDDGPWSTATVPFSQKEFFFRTPWFVSAVALLLIAAFALAHRARVNVIRASAERVTLLVDRTPAGSFRATQAGGILDCNDACARMLGFATRADLMAHGLADLNWVETEWEAIVRRLRDQNSLVNFETAVRRSDESDVWLLMNASLVTDGQRHPIIEATVVDISARTRDEEEVRYKAHHDVLTGLPNRALFKDRLTVALNYAHRNGSQLAVLCLDLDGFKVINDALGRSGGDALLKTVASRLRDSCRREDSVARVGDDEFSLLVLKPANVGVVTGVARKVLQAIAAPITVDGNDFNVTCSMGISFYPQDGADAETLLKNADSALYRAKEAGRNSFQLCSPFLARKAADRLTLETGLHQALDQDEFVLHYQPQLDLETQTVTGMEALIRWDRHGKTTLRPADFIAVAEDTQLIIPIGEWVMEAACRQGQRWHEQGTGVRIAVNVSARQFQQPNIVTVIRAALDRTGFDPNYLEIEITESTAMFDPDLTADILLDLKNLGISVAIDDFGVGHSSLNYLKRFPIDALKIDQSFVQDITRGASDGAIISAVIALSKALNIRVIAEGVETEDQLRFLRDHGCHEAQGYLFCRPLPADTLTQMMESASPGAYTRRYARKVMAAAPPLQN